MAVDAEPRLIVADAVALAQEPQEVADHLAVRVRERHVVAALRAFGPEEHAAGAMQRIAGPRQLATALLGGEPGLAREPAPGELSGAPPRGDRIGRLEPGQLLIGQRDVPHPEAHG